jgi:putative aldouronate transport system permease protein
MQKEAVFRTSGRIEQFFNKMWRDKCLYLMILPGIIFMVLFRYLPMGGLIIAFKNYSLRKGIWGSAWVGLENFRFVFTQNPDFYSIVSNTLVINLLRLLFSFPFPIFIALLINELQEKRLKKFVQTTVYLPYFVSWVVFGGIVLQFLSTSGFVNKVIELFGFSAIPFMQKSEYFKGIVVATDIWKNAGWSTIIYLSALTSIDQEIYEAAKIDGANGLQTVFRISIPGISDTIIVLLLLQIGAIMDVGFEQIYVLCRPILYQVGDVISTYIYRIGIGNAQFSMTAAIGLFQSFVGLIMILLANMTCKKLFEKSLW